MRIINTLIIILILLSSCNNQKKKTIQVRINKNIETLAVLYLVSDIGLNAHKGSLSFEAGLFFDSHKNHEAVTRFKQFMNKTSFDAPVKLFLQMADFPHAILPASIKVDTNSVVIDNKKIDLSDKEFNLFIESLNKFYVDSDIESFINKNNHYYDKCIQEVVKNLPDNSFISTMEDYYGKEFKEYTIIPSPILFPQIGFGIKIPNHQDEYIYYIAGPFEQPNAGKYSYGFNSPIDIRAMSVHEFGHSFVNPLTENPKNKKLINTYAHLFTPIEATMKNQGYSNWWICITEHLVRLGEIRIAVVMNDLEGANNLRNEYINSREFIYLTHFENEIKKYENNREKYQSFSDFLPELLNSLSEIKNTKR